jgi:hypothetical protein
VRIDGRTGEVAGEEPRLTSVHGIRAIWRRTPLGGSFVEKRWKTEIVMLIRVAAKA